MGYRNELPRRWRNEDAGEYQERLAQMEGERAEQQAESERARQAAVDAMDPDGSPALVEPSSTRVRLVVRGRISNVRYLEEPSYHARKARDGRYAHYELEVPAEEVRALVGRLEGTTLAEQYRDADLEVRTGVWCEEHPISDPIPVHPAYRSTADFLTRERADLLRPLGLQLPVDGNSAHRHVLEQIRKLQRRYTGRPEEREIADIYTQGWREGGDAYERQRARLQGLNSRILPARDRGRR